MRADYFGCGQRPRHVLGVLCGKLFFFAIFCLFLISVIQCNPWLNYLLVAAKDRAMLSVFYFFAPFAILVVSNNISTVP